MFLYNFKKNFFYFFRNFQKSELLSPYILATTLLYTNIPQEVSKKKVEILAIDFFSYWQLIGAVQIQNISLVQKLPTF